MTTSRPKMDVRGMTWGFPGTRGEWGTREAAESMRLMTERLRTNTAGIAFCGWQDTAFSTEVKFRAAPTVTDDEVGAIREAYSGIVTYNCDKYQEANVTWWDAVDVISSSGYYPIDDWDKQLDRIEAVVRREDKPFLFLEAGAMSTEGSQHLPHSWALKGDISQEAQRDWYQAMFAACDRRDWVGGWVLWDWKALLHPLEAAATDPEYALYGKLAEAIVVGRYSSGPA